MDAKSYVVTCLSCKGKSRLKIINDRDVLYQDLVPIISARLRPDLKWGFECTCGNDSRVALEEKDNLRFLVKAGEHSIKQIAQNLSAKNHLQFKMEIA